MFGIGGTELLVILVVALLVLGPKKLPEVARTLGKAMGELRRVSTEFQRTLNTEIAFDEEARQREAQKASAPVAEEQAAPSAVPATDCASSPSSDDGTGQPPSTGEHSDEPDAFTGGESAAPGNERGA